MRALARVVLIASLIAACRGVDPGSQTPHRPIPPGPEVRQDAALPAGAVARCGTELMISRWPITAAFVSDDGDVRIIESRDGELVLRDPAHARAVASLGAAIDARFSSDGKSLFKLESSADKKTLTIARVDAETSAVRFTVSEAMEHFQPTWVVSRDNATITIAATREIASFDGETGKRIRLMPLRDQQALALASDAPVALTRPPQTEILSLVDLLSAKPIREVNVPETLRELPHRYLLSADGRRIIAVSPSGVWATQADKDVLEQRAGFAAAREDTYAGVPDAMLLDGGSSIHVALRERSVQVGLTSRSTRALPGDSASALAASTNGKYQLLLHGTRLLLEGSSYQPPNADEATVSELFYFAGDSRLATLSDKLNVWDGATCKHLASLDDVGGVLAASSEAGVLAVTRQDGTISVLDGDLRELKRLRTPYDFRGASLDAAGKALWLVVWSASDEPTRREASPRGTLALPAQQGVFRVDLVSWEITRLDDSKQPGRADTALISPSGERIALSGQAGLAVNDPLANKPFFRVGGGRTFGFAGARSLLTYEGNAGMLRGNDVTEPFRAGPLDFTQHIGGQPIRLAAQAGGAKVAFTFAKEVALIDPREGKLLGAVPARDTAALALSKDGKRVAIASKEGVLLWDTEKLVPASGNLATERSLAGVSSIAQLSGGYWGHTIAVVDGRLGLFNADRQKPFATLTGDDVVSRAAATSEATCFIVAGDTRCEGRLPALFRSEKHGPVDRRRRLLTTPAKASEVSVGNGVACALDVQGDVTCIGEFTPAFEPYKKPTRVLGDASAIAVGGSHACALKKDGHIACWGEGSDGQVGSLQDKSVQVDISTAASGPRHQVMKPFVVPGVENATAIVSGEDHSCALLAGGTVICWGSNDHGQCGLRRGEDLDPGVIAGLADVNAISVGRDLSCALQKNGDVSCWGALGSSVQFYGPTSIAKLVGPAKAMRVIDESVCIEKPSATVSCFTFSPATKRY